MMLSRNYVLLVGNAVPVFNKNSFPKLDAWWEVDNSYVAGSPSFPKNLDPKYSFDQFARATHLVYFFNRISNSKGVHNPNSAVGITVDDYQEVARRLNFFKEHEESLRKDLSYGKYYSSNLDVLIWLEWWMKYAIQNFRTPAIQCY